MKKPKKPKRKVAPKCGWCGHTKGRHNIAGCMGDGGPGAGCSCDGFITGTP